LAFCSAAANSCRSSFTFINGNDEVTVHHAFSALDAGGKCIIIGIALLVFGMH